MILAAFIGRLLSCGATRFTPIIPFRGGRDGGGVRGGGGGGPFGECTIGRALFGGGPLGGGGLLGGGGWDIAVAIAMSFINKSTTSSSHSNIMMLLVPFQCIKSIY